MTTTAAKRVEVSAADFSHMRNWLATYMAEGKGIALAHAETIIDRESDADVLLDYISYSNDRDLSRLRAEVEYTATFNASREGRA